MSRRNQRLDEIYTSADYDRGEFLEPSFHWRYWSDTKEAVWLRYPHSADWRQRRVAMSVAEVFAKIVSLFEQDIEQIANQVSKIVAVIHTNPFSDCILSKESPDPFDAYEGSALLGQLLGGCAQQQEVLCICGHRHKALDITASGVRVVRSPVGYLDDFKGDYALKAAEVVRQYVI